MAKSNISPVLFMTVDGEPMSFFLRPGPVKLKLQPLITAGGGMLCNVQQPGAILLIDPEERASVAESTAHWYISTQYIRDCIEKNEQLNLEDYRVNPVVGPKKSARLNNTKENCSGLLGGRLAYTPEDDAAILSYVNKHKTEVGGNRLWQEMEKQRLTSHSWQSMKYRYKVRLAKKQSEAAEVGKTEEETEASEEESKGILPGSFGQVEGNKEREGEKPSGIEDAASPETTESDPKQPENVEAQTSMCSQGEEQQVDPEKDKQPVETTKGETDEPETCNSPQDEGHCLDLPTDSDPLPAGRAEPHSDDPQTEVSPQKESMPENVLPTQLPDSSSQSKQMQKPSPRPEQSQRRSTRRQLQLDESPSPEHYNKRLRSSASFTEQPSSSPHPLKKTKQAINSALHTTVNQTPSKKARGRSLAAMAESQQENGQAPVSETAPADVSQKGKKRKEKRKLGILEMATKEFEDESESDDIENSSETSVKNPIEPPLPSPDTAASTQSGLEPGPRSGPASGPGLDIQKNMQETQASRSSSPAPAGHAETEATSTTSKVHLFIFNNSHEDDSQSISVDNTTAAPANPEPTVSTKSTLSLTQSQLEEDKQQIRELMSETNQDLVTVTKALLKTSGDFSKARDLLLNNLISGPLWQCCDDNLLIPGDPAVLQQMQEKYSEELVAKRIVFLELEGWQKSGRTEGCFS